MTRQVAVALGALVVLIGATLAADTTVARPVAPTATFTEDVEVTNGTWYCLPLARDGESATLSIAAVGEDASQISVERVDGGESAFEPTARLEPGAVQRVDVEGGAVPPAVVIRWRGGPVVASWTVGGDAQRVGASCTQSPAPRWTFSGADTTLGSSARLYLFNPFEGDAVVRVAFATPEGRVDLVSSENVSVPARSVVDLGINELQGEQPDLGVVVEVEAGRVIASALQRFGQPDVPDVELEGAELPVDPRAPEGRTVLPATATASDTLGIAYAADGPDTTSWLTLLNPSERPAEVTVGVSDAVAGTPLEQEVVVGPESVERVDLAGVSSAPSFGVTVTAAGDIDVTATGFIASLGDTRSVTAVAATGEPDAFAAQPIGLDAGAEVALFNPGETPATATVTVGGTSPEAWSAVELEPGRMQLLTAATAGVAGDDGPLEVSADRPVHATVRLATDDGATRLLALPLVPASVWGGSTDALAPERDRTLETRPVDFPAPPDP